jgi:hypothetical protein
MILGPDAIDKWASLDWNNAVGRKTEETDSRRFRAFTQNTSLASCLHRPQPWSSRIDFVEDGNTIANNTDSMHRLDEMKCLLDDTNGSCFDGLSNSFCFVCLSCSYP